MTTDPLTQRILEIDADRKANPWNWQYVSICRVCGREAVKPIGRAEVFAAREVYGLAPDAHVTIQTICEKCDDAEDDAEEEATP